MNIDFNGINFYGFLTILVIVFALIILGIGILLVIRSLLKNLKKIKTPIFELEKTGEKKEDLPDENNLPDLKNSIIEEKKIRITKNLTEHPFFDDMLFFERVHIPNLKIANELKKIVVIAFLTIKFQVFRTRLFDYVANQEMVLKSGGEILIDDINKVFLDGIAEYNQLARDKKIEYRNKIIRIPEIFIKKFDEWHNPHIDMTFESINPHDA